MAAIFLNMAAPLPSFRVFRMPILMSKAKRHAACTAHINLTKVYREPTVCQVLGYRYDRCDPSPHGGNMMSLELASWRPWISGPIISGMG